MKLILCVLGYRYLKAIFYMSINTVKNGWNGYFFEFLKEDEKCLIFNVQYVDMNIIESH